MATRSAAPLLIRSGIAAHDPIVFLHGFTGSARSWNDVAAALGAAPILRAHLPGHHPDAPVAGDFPGNVQWLARTLAGAGATSYHLVGYSLGGRVALALALIAPKRVRRLTLVSVHPGLRDQAARRLRRHTDRRWADLLRQRGIDAFVTRWEAQPLFASQASVSAGALAAQQAIRRGHDPEALARCLEAMGLGSMPPAWDHLAALAMPIDIVVGRRDSKFVAVGECLASHCLHASLHVVEDAGHNLVLERPEALGQIVCAARPRSRRTPHR